MCYNRLSREWVVLDLDSAHGTRANGKLAAKVTADAALTTLQQAAPANAAQLSPEVAL